MQTDQELIRTRDELSEELTLLKKKLRSSKIGTTVKAITASLLIVGGTAVACVFPNPMVIAALGGAATLLGGGNGVLKTVRRDKKKGKQIRKQKGELENLSSEVSDRELTRKVANGMRTLTNQNYYETMASAPPNTESASLPNGIYPPLITN